MKNKPMKIRFRSRLCNTAVGIAFTLLAVLAGLGSAAHPFYVSVTDVEYLAEEQLLGVTIRVFTDDLEAALRAQGAPKLDLGAPSEHPEANRWVATYLDSKLSWRLNGQPRTCHWLGKEVENDVTFLYLEARQVSHFPDIELTHRLFLETFDTQENIVHLHCAGNLASARLNRVQPKGQLSCR